MTGSKLEEFYALMLNAMAGLQDDMIANGAPKEAQDLLHRSLTICREDYNVKFSTSFKPVEFRER